ncbi:MAG: hypothetical protein KAH84_04350 [Thiomargarita sp.]|nr:hypothetical protein [Thiomargarita sp.]
MEKPLFSQLFYGTYELESFATEVLAGVLCSEQALLDSFVNKVLGIKGRNFTVKTQYIYDDISINMVFSNKENLCFLENAANIITENQHSNLQDYQTILELEQSEYANIYLRYCSKYYTTQTVDEVDFAQFRWADIYLFFNDYKQNSLVKIFLDFLEDTNMKGITELNTNDLVAISTFNDTIKKIDECLDSIAAEFTMLFGYPTKGAPRETQERLKLMLELRSYRMMKHNVLPKGGGWSEITACFDYERLTGTETYLAVWYWCDREHFQYDLFRTLFKQNKHLFSIHPGFIFEERPTGMRIIIQKPLSDFNTKTNQLQSIHNWFVKTLKIFRQFADKTDELEWNIPI